jgi:membrane protein required for colicin V production
MTALDIITLLLVGLGVFRGVQKGFVYAVLSLGVWVLVILALWLLHGPVSRALSGAMAPSGAYAFAFVIIFAGAFFGGKFLTSRVSKGVRRSVIGPADRLLGAGFGALKGLVYATLFFMAFSFVYDMIWTSRERRPAWIENAFTYPLVRSTADLFVNFAKDRQGGAAEPATANKAREKQRPKQK